MQAYVYYLASLVVGDGCIRNSDMIPCTFIGIHNRWHHRAITSALLSRRFYSRQASYRALPVSHHHFWDTISY
jgi:hypothetical protein